MTFSEGAYFAFPDAVLHWAIVAFSGVGMRRTILVALSLGLNPVFTVMLYWTCDVPISVTVGCTRKGKCTSEVERYLCGNQCDSTRIVGKHTSSTQTLHPVG
jgi:hypothetical protein